MQPAVSCAIPGARRVSQVEENMAAADLPEIAAEAMQRVQHLYADKIRPSVHARW
jgi:aryl-alcohol dehydrogenase-like predicted oxidoreductase